MTLEKFKAHAKALLGPEANLLNPLVAGNKGDVLYHISTNPNIKEFIPAVTNRTVDNEDRRIPRICVSDSLAGCMSGYANVFSDMTEGEEWKGGYYIYALPYEVAAIPDKKLLESVEETDEIWIVGHDEKHRVIEPTVIGKLIPIEYKVVNNRAEEAITGELRVAVTIYDRAAVKLSRNVFISWGFYEFTLYQRENGQFYNLDEVAHTQITESEWRKVKGLCAGLLSYQTAPSSRW